MIWIKSNHKEWESNGHGTWEFWVLCSLFPAILYASLLWPDIDDLDWIQPSRMEPAWI
jgi:hypothetical protein